MEWVKCSERTPERTQTLIVFSHGEVVPAIWNYCVSPVDYKKYRAFTYLSGTEMRGVTHWMSLPEPPSE
ncbi:DUF551 domain-containing protein [Enterobacter hormaechei]|uniref:DUF551 domain-containing protein n=1 Tax=Enterobacter hormaechei TaxID=158836 RepID=UPI00079BE6BA|nr:Protein of uncharacterised function (DUF551) [Enterobacter hormaechei]CZY62556.1 Protein of uncharacterised function (DUF551) [Enterobacter hormaechei]CZY72552.1 Protein of uncharacterised function (DUF551) [Enterobacter hormaechei]SAF37056.1 Protein of uncharacterised function (DUF551) [Enterobacter hormaechei]